MDELAALIGWTLHRMSDLFAPHGWTWRRALLLIVAAALLSAGLFALALPTGLDWLAS